MGYAHKGYGKIFCQRKLTQKEKGAVDKAALWFTSGLRIMFDDTGNGTCIGISMAGHLYDGAKTRADLESLTAAIAKDGIGVDFGELVIEGDGATKRFLLRDSQWVEQAAQIIWIDVGLTNTARVM